MLNVIKLIHLLCVLGLLGCISYCIIAPISKRVSASYLFTQFYKTLQWLAFLALITGTLLVHPKNFTFHTPWIQAAYVLLALFILGILCLNRYLTKRDSHKKYSFLLSLFYFFLAIILVLIVHDAVTKTTFLF